MSALPQLVSRPNNSDIKNRTPREQKYAPATHLYHQGRLISFYLNWQGKTQLIGIPHIKCFKVTELYPLDLGYMFQEMYSIMEQKRVQNFSIHIFKRDWDVAPHLFFKIGMAQELYNNFVTVPHINASDAPRHLPSPKREDNQENKINTETEK
jgi:hypothetical protein